MQALILECAIRACLIAICTGAVLHILRVKAARVRHTVWASVVVWMLALPVWTAWGPRAVVRAIAEWGARATRPGGLAAPGARCCGPDGRVRGALRVAGAVARSRGAGGRLRCGRSCIRDQYAPFGEG